MASLLVGVAPFGLVVGTAMVSSGGRALGMSVLVYGGASRFAAIAAVLVARRTESLVATIAVGMAVLVVVRTIRGAISSCIRRRRRGVRR